MRGVSSAQSLFPLVLSIIRKFVYGLVLQRCFMGAFFSYLWQLDRAKMVRTQAVDSTVGRKNVRFRENRVSVCVCVCVSGCKAWAAENERHSFLFK